MIEQAQVGDTVRLKFTIEGIVQKTFSGILNVNNMWLDLPDRTYEILHRATPPLPSEYGYYVGYDKMLEADILVIVVNGKIRLPNANNTGGLGHVLGNPERFAPFHQLVLK